MTKINIRKLNTKDLRDLLDFVARYMRIASERKSGFERRLLLSYFSGKPFSLLGTNTFIGTIAETDDEHIIGTIFARRFPFGKSWVIGPVLVHSNFRSSGIATSMMDFTVEHIRKERAKHAILSVEISNIQARRFFEKSKFKYLGPVFMNHDKARKYVQVFTLTSGYLQRITNKIEKYPLQTKIAHSDQESRPNGTKTWCIMLRKL